MSGECYCVALRTAARKATAIYDAALQPVGVNVAQFSLLRNLARSAPVSLTELGRMVDLDRSTVGRNVRLLQHMGLVRLGAGADHREATVALAEPALELLEQAAPLWNEAQHRIETCLGHASATQLRTLLRSLRALP